MLDFQIYTLTFDLYFNLFNNYKFSTHHQCLIKYLNTLKKKIITIALSESEQPKVYAKNNDDDDDEDCVVNIKHEMNKGQPLLITAKSPAQFIYPNQSNPITIYVNEDENLRLVCNDESIYVICRDNVFWIEGTDKKFTMKEFNCRDDELGDIIRPIHSGKYHFLKTQKTNDLTYQFISRVSIKLEVPTNWISN